MNKFSDRLSNYKFYQFLHDAKVRYIEYKNKKISIKQIKRKIKSNKKAALYLFSPTYSNLGDHAIALTTTEMLKSMGLSYIEITDRELFLLNRYNSLNLFNGRKILFNGGGYLGTIWLHCEHLARKIVLANPKSRIVFLPNTIYYENNTHGKEELKKSMMVYNVHHNLTFYARERISYEYMKKVYKDVKLCPDVVLSVNKGSFNNIRTGCLICLRDDCERTLSDKKKSALINQIEIVFHKNYTVTDMDLHSDPNLVFDISNRSEAIEKKFDEFRNSQLVITDRLHGMIFSAITGTPCIVINSKSPKVKGCYEWVKDLGYIRFCDDISKIHDIIENLISLKNCKYNPSVFSEYFSNLMVEISK